MKTHGARVGIEAASVPVVAVTAHKMFFEHGTAGREDLDYVRDLGAERVIDYRKERFDEIAFAVDAVMDTVGGEVQDHSLRVLKRGCILVSSVSPPDEKTQPSTERRLIISLSP